MNFVEKTAGVNVIVSKFPLQPSIKLIDFDYILRKSRG